MSDLFVFPFLADVWGTVADWAIVLITGLTLYQLVRTLKSQLIVQKLQQRSTELQNEGYRRLNHPYFTMKVVSKKTVKTDDDMFDTRFVVDLHLNKNQCFNLKLFLWYDSAKYNFKIEPYLQMDHMAENAHYKLRISRQQKSFPIHESLINVLMTFEDPTKNKYRQRAQIEYHESSWRITVQEKSEYEVKRHIEKD